MSEKYIKASECEKYFYEHLDDNNMIGAMNAIEEMPAADVALVRHGHWIDNKHTDTAICSECKCVFTDETNYCPNCGSRMGGEIK